MQTAQQGGASHKQPMAQSFDPDTVIKTGYLHKRSECPMHRASAAPARRGAAVFMVMANAALLVVGCMSDFDDSMFFQLPDCSLRACTEPLSLLHVCNMCWQSSTCCQWLQQLHHWSSFFTNRNI